MIEAVKKFLEKCGVANPKAWFQSNPKPPVASRSRSIFFLFIVLLWRCTNHHFAYMCQDLLGFDFIASILKD
ncbi:hypothetical protein E2C01_032404 [Portunus trituberculatus]|uniref:Uncharacterized protein n=1 Tax=Portunus trituberculatus TaxID=210409 RepID=A0A5B7F0U9_PORTR|nr:hypothetical protein [Portunus trituberculatus]